MTTSQEVLAGERNGDGWTLKWTTWLALDEDERWWWQVDAHRTGTVPWRDGDDRPPIWRALDVPVHYDSAPVSPVEEGWLRIACRDGSYGDVKEGQFLVLDGGTLDFGSGMGVIWNGPCDSRDAALAAVDGFLRMGMP